MLSLADPAVIRLIIVSALIIIAMVAAIYIKDRNKSSKTPEKQNV